MEYNGKAAEQISGVKMENDRVVKPNDNSWKTNCNISKASVRTGKSNCRAIMANDKSGK